MWLVGLEVWAARCQLPTSDKYQPPFLSRCMGRAGTISPPRRFLRAALCNVVARFGDQPAPPPFV